MQYENTICLIKPDITIKKLQFEVLNLIIKNGFIIKKISNKILTKNEAKKFYEIHQERPFFNELCDFISSGEIYCCLLEKQNCIQDFRKFMGNTNPELAEVGTLRKMFGTDICLNAIHGSDSLESFLSERCIID